MSLFKPATEPPIELDPASVNQAPATRKLAEVLSAVIEAARTNDREKYGPMISGGNALMGPWDERTKSYATYWVDRVPWFEYATRPEILASSAQQLGVEVETMALRISTELSPPNSRELFWYAMHSIAQRELVDILALARQALSLADKGQSVGDASRRLNRAKHRLTTERASRIPSLWATYRAQGMPKNQAAPIIADALHLAVRTVRDKLKGM